MQTADYLKILKDEIHSVVFATIDENGLPDARVIDIMLDQAHCLHCGRYYVICPKNAILKRGR